MQPANRLHPGICTGTISAKRHSRRPRSIASRHPAVPPLLRCTRLPAVPSPFGRARYPAVPPLFGCNPVIPLCRPVQKRPAALRYRPVGRQLAALSCRPVQTQARHPTISFLFEYPPLPRRRIARRPSLTSCPLFEHDPVPPLGNSIRMHPTVPLCRCSQTAPVALPYRNRPAVAFLFE